MFFKKSPYKKNKAEQKKDISVILSFYLLRTTKMYYKKRRTSICSFDKCRALDIVKCHILYEAN